MPEIWFYHLTNQPLERALPSLLERTLSRGWRAVIEIGDEERLRALDELLWTWSDESFLAHGTAADGDPNLQPIFLTTGADNPNGATVRFFVGDADIRTDLTEAYERLIFMFDGGDENRVVAARETWKQLRDAGANLVYWRQNEDGRWEKLG